MTGPHGLYQHARGSEPDPAFGYCTDDVARAALVDLAHDEASGSVETMRSIDRHLSFLDRAFDRRTGRFRNLLDADGRWIDDGASEDAHARAIQALGAIAGGARSTATRAVADHLLRRAIHDDRPQAALRPNAYVVLGCVDAAYGGGDRSDVIRSLERSLGAIADAVRRTRPAWPWPERVVTYDNGVVPRALIVGGDALADRSLVDRGVSMLDWLAAAQTTADGRATLVGTEGWWPRGGHPAPFDQQPIEADSMVQAASAAWRATGDEGYREMAWRFYRWFLGDNIGGRLVARPGDGACHDGLTPDGVNENQGAESTLAWLASTETMRRLGETA